MDLLYRYFKALTNPESPKRKPKNFLEMFANFGMVVILIPAVFFYNVYVVLPLVAEKWTLTYFTHLFIATYLVINIIANMLYGILTDTTIKKKTENTVPNQDWTTCPVCECLRPPRTWHCDDCHICILKRDHHCVFWACCIGQFNRRYFILFTMYLFIAMAYSNYFIIVFLAQLLTWNCSIMKKFLCPILCFLVDPNIETIFVFLIVLNALVTILTGSLFFYHFYNIINGKIVPDAKHYPNCSYNTSWKWNIIEVLGSRWYLTWIFPFVNSPLPDDDFKSIVEDKYK